MTTFVVVSMASAFFALVGLALLRTEPVAVATNHRGRRLRVVLGLGIGFAVSAIAAVSYVVASRWRPLRLAGGIGLSFWAGAMVILLAGWYDDKRAGPRRGLAAHFGGLARGEVTPGIVKLVAIVVAATAVAIDASPGLWRAVVGVPAVAGCANLWNLLDVRPGRCLKFFLVAALALAPFAGRHDPVVVPSAFGAAVLALPIDLGEHAMLGDAGSNLLGFVVGVGVFLTLPVWGLAVVLAVVLGLHYAAETTTLSRVIERIPALRWFDRLGRRDGSPAGYIRPDH